MGYWSAILLMFSPAARLSMSTGNVRLQGEASAGDPAPAVMHTDTVELRRSDSAIASTKSDVRIDFGGTFSDRARPDRKFERAARCA